MFIVGQVNKDGAIAGPKVMEPSWIPCFTLKGIRCCHTVSCGQQNRYGSTNEIGMFDMTGQGLAEIENPLRCWKAVLRRVGQLRHLYDGGHPPDPERDPSPVTKTNFPTPPAGLQRI